MVRGGLRQRRGDEMMGVGVVVEDLDTIVFNTFMKKTHYVILTWKIYALNSEMKVVGLI